MVIKIPLETILILKLNVKKNLDRDSEFLYGIGMKPVKQTPGTCCTRTRVPIVNRDIFCCHVLNFEYFIFYKFKNLHMTDAKL